MAASIDLRSRAVAVRPRKVESVSKSWWKVLAWTSRWIL
jgi:hypothetical protein